MATNPTTLTHKPIEPVAPLPAPAAPSAAAPQIVNDAQPPAQTTAQPAAGVPGSAPWPTNGMVPSAGGATDAFRFSGGSQAENDYNALAAISPALAGRYYAAAAGGNPELSTAAMNQTGGGEAYHSLQNFYGSGGGMGYGGGSIIRAGGDPSLQKMLANLSPEQRSAAEASLKAKGFMPDQDQFLTTMSAEQAAAWGMTPFNGMAPDPNTGLGLYSIAIPSSQGSANGTGNPLPGGYSGQQHAGAMVPQPGAAGPTTDLSISEWLADQQAKLGALGAGGPSAGAPNPTAGTPNPTAGATGPQGGGIGAGNGVVDAAIQSLLGGHQPGTPPLNPAAAIGLNEDRSLNTLQAGTNPVLGAVTPDKTVQGQLDNLLKSGNPLLEAAKARAMKQAASRGLVNSSIAAQAGEEAMVASALPIAQQDASTAYNQGIANQDVQNLFIRDKYATSADMIKSYETYRQTNAMFDKDESLKRYLNDSTISSEEKRVALNNAAQLEQTRINADVSLANNQLNADVSFANNKLNADVSYANNKLDADVAYANAQAANATSLANAATSANTQLATAALAAQTQSAINNANNATSITNTNTQAQVNLYGIDKQSQVNLVANYNNNVASIMSSQIAKDEKPNAVGYLSTWTGGDVNTNVTIDPPPGASTTSPINPTGVPQPPPIGIVNGGLPENLGGG